MFAEFQLQIHEELEQGRALSGARMTELYCNLLKKFHGDAEGVMKINPAYCTEWAYIPHFYTASMSGSTRPRWRARRNSPTRSSTKARPRETASPPYSWPVPRT